LLTVATMTSVASPWNKQMFVGLLVGALLFTSWLFLGGVSIFIASFLCHLALGKIAGSTPAIVGMCLIGIAVGVFLTVWLLALILSLCFPWMSNEVAHRMLPVAFVVGGIVGGWAAIFPYTLSQS